TTGHEWDGIKELNTPLPRWWLTTFYLTIIWAIGYWIVYPAWPLISTHTTGLLGYSTRASLAVELANLETARGEKMAALAAASLADIEKDPALLALARAKGRTVFGDNCAPCHGSGAAGAKGYPNLNDDDWLWGGTLDQIMQTIQYGARSGHAKTMRAPCLPLARRESSSPNRSSRSPITFARCRACRQFQDMMRLQAQKSSQTTAQRATATRGRGIRRSVRRISPTRSGSTALMRQRSSKRSPMAA